MLIKLKSVRENNYLTQRDVAKLLKISKTSYNYFETGERIIPSTHLNNFCNLLHVSSDYLLGLSNYSVVTKENCIISKALIGKRIKEVRLLNKLTQQELASIFHTTQSTLSSYENGHTLILTAFLYEMCKRLNVSSDYILGRSNTIQINLN